MPKLDDKMNLIGIAITSQADKEREAVIEKANAYRERELAACKDDLIESMFQKVQKQTRAVRQKAVGDRAQAELSAQREVLNRRQELTTAVFNAARTGLREYAAAEPYRQALRNGIKALAGQYDHTSSTVYLREADLGLEREIAALLPGCKVVRDGSIQLGGFKLLNAAAGILVDETLDSRLEEQKPWFLQACGLKAV